MTDFVWLSGKPDIAQLEPQFIVKVGSIYYLTKAVWEYDSSKAVTPDQIEGCAQITQEFNNLSPDLVARQRQPGAGGGGDPNQTGAS
jgi:hypothetical protein